MLRTRVCVQSYRKYCSDTRIQEKIPETRVYDTRLGSRVQKKRVSSGGVSCIEKIDKIPIGKIAYGENSL